MLSVFLVLTGSRHLAFSLSITGASICFDFSHEPRGCGVCFFESFSPALRLTARARDEVRKIFAMGIASSDDLIAAELYKQAVAAKTKIHSGPILVHQCVLFVVSWASLKFLIDNYVRSFNFSQTSQNECIGVY